MNKGYAICFNEWALDENIKNELRLLLIISSLTAKDGYCFASNNYLAELFAETEQTISKKIKNLENYGYIEIEYEKRGWEITNRKIRLTKILMDDYEKSQQTINKNLKDNNTSINNTSINNIYIGQVVDYLNEKIGTKYKSTTASTKSHITARLREGFTIDDFKKVIDTKVKEWKDTKYQKYLRPETLFGTKFESYLNQKEKENWWNE